MGFFDRFKSFWQVPSDGNNSVPDEQGALRLLEEGILLEEEGQLAEALQRYEAAIALAPGLARAHFNRGNILLKKGDRSRESYTSDASRSADKCTNLICMPAHGMPFKECELLTDPSSPF